MIAYPGLQSWAARSRGRVRDRPTGGARPAPVARAARWSCLARPGGHCGEHTSDGSWNSSVASALMPGARLAQGCPLAHRHELGKRQGRRDDCRARTPSFSCGLPGVERLAKCQRLGVVLPRMVHAIVGICASQFLGGAHGFPGSHEPSETPTRWRPLVKERPTRPRGEPGRDDSAQSAAGGP